MGFQQKKQTETIQSVARLDIWQLIMTNSKDKNPATDLGCTPLSMAAKNGHTEIFQLIFDQVQEKNPADVDGYTGLHNGYPCIPQRVMGVMRFANSS